MTALAATLSARAVLNRLNGGFLQVYEGENVLTQMRFADPAFGPVDDGFAVAHPLTVGKARRSGTARTWAALDANSTPVLMGLVGDAMLLSQNGIEAGADVKIESFTYRQES